MWSARGLLRPDDLVAVLCREMGSSGQHTSACFLAALLASSLARPVGAVSFEAERELGRNFALAARQQLPIINDPTIVGYVERIGQRIVSSLDDSFFEYHFEVVREGGINAFAVPGGYIYVHSGLLANAANDDEIAAVLGHEVAHIHAHHLARQQEATQFMSYTALLGVLLSVIQPGLGAVAAAASQTVQLQYSRQFEQEADYMGSRHARAAGYDAQGMLDFLQKLRDLQRLMPTSIPPYLLSHPLTDERLNHLEAVLRTHQWSGNPRAEKSFALQRVQVLARTQTSPQKEVLETYRAALEKDVTNPEARYFFGLACLETGHFKAAHEALTAARDAGIVIADRELGVLFLRSRQPGKALPLLRHAVELDPEDAAAHASLAQALEVSGETEAAMAEYRRTIKLAPTFDVAHHALGMLAGRAGESADGLYHLATSLRLRGQYAFALTQYDKLQQLLSAGDPRAHEVGLTIDELNEFLGNRKKSKKN